MLSIRTTPHLDDDGDEDSYTDVSGDGLDGGETSSTTDTAFGSGEYSGLDYELMRAMAAARYVSDPLADDSTFAESIEEEPAAPTGPVHALDEILKVEEATDHFTAEEFGPVSNMRLYDEKVASEASKYFLFSMIRPRQFFIGGVMYRERAERKVTWDELFMDLVFVGALAKTAHILRVSDMSTTLLNQFTLVFVVVWMSFILIQQQINRFGLQGFGSRLIYWIYMILVAGLGLNAAHVWDDYKGKSTANLFVGTYLAIRLLYCFVHVGVMISYPKFMKHLAISIFSAYKYRAYLWWTGFAFESIAFAGTIFVIRYVWGLSSMKYRVSVNIEHHVERFCCFTMAILGEIVVALLWPSDYKNMSTPYAATILGLIVATSFQWLYYNIDRQHHYTHAIRRSAFTGVFWQILHFPYHLALTTSGGALANLIATVKAQADYQKKYSLKARAAATDVPTYVTDSVRIVWFGALALALTCSAAIGMMHKNHDHHARIQKKHRVYIRLVVAGVFVICAPFAATLSPVAMISVPAVLMLALTILEEYGRLNNPNYKHDENHHHHHNARKHPHGNEPTKAITPPPITTMQSDSTFLTATQSSSSDHPTKDELISQSSDFDPAPCMKEFVSKMGSNTIRDLESAPSPQIRRRHIDKFVRRWHGAGGGAHAH
ncbi:hypothetical protein HDU67_009638 [Dinochytrium kinnereticum]|nr:hypothetical protein HDU67_009638 [Dinochytrium kinnereticum]